MSADYFSDYQSFVSSSSMLTPAETPYETPPLSRSRRSSKRGTPREISSSPPQLPSDASDPPRQNDGNVFGIDPKRFTPTLHASLVSEILTLRRELESKHRFIDNLESSFASVKSENENLSSQLTQSAKESRLADHRFKTLENGTLDAVEDLVRERDDAKSASAELKAKLDNLNKRSRKQEEETVQSYNSWEREKQSWENERRQLERRVHVTESRLRTFVEEMSIQQNALERQDIESEPGDSAFKDSGLGNDSDAGSIRSYRPLKHMRNQSSISIRSIARSFGSPKKGLTSTNLADELGFDEEEEYDMDESEHDDDELLGTSMLGRTSSRRSVASTGSSKAMKLLGLSDAASQGRSDTKDIATSNSSGAPRPGSIPEIAAQLGLQLAGAALRYVDSGVQSSRPPSPAILPSKPKDVITLDEARLLDGPRPDNSVHAYTKDAGQTRLSLVDQRQKNVPLSPPETPVAPTIPMSNELDRAEIRPVYQCSSTQTNFSETSQLSSLRRNSTAESVSIPFIAIHPPMSPSSGLPVLPPGTADASVQTDSDIPTNSRDAAVQTEEIRIDNRPIKLPPHLLPSSVDDFVYSETVVAKQNDGVISEIAGSQSFVQGPRRNSNKLPLKALDLPRPILLAAAREEERMKDKPSAPFANTSTIQSYFGNSTKWHESDTAEEYTSDIDPNDIFGTTPGLTRHRSAFNGPPKTVPEDREISPAHDPLVGSSRRDSEVSSPGARPWSSRGRVGSSWPSHAGTHYQSRSPSPTSRGSSSQGTSSQPPFPIPLRSSSRVRSVAASEGNSSPTRQNTRSLASRRSDRDMYLARKPSLRKVQSSSTMKSATRMSPRRRRRAQLTPIQSMAFDSSLSFTSPIPDTPLESATFSPQTDYSDTAEVRNIMQASESAIEDNSNQEASLVDAIAATMVGEWMWKYVRRRRSFGVGESTPSEDGMNGTRHKRWVWLSPYERTVMWSSKQPNSGTALLGKTGRKLTIKSVLDVKDDNPPPRSATADAIFDRSILILTPERALKITASNKQRHYLWLTALSFLAQSGRGPPQVLRVPPADETIPKQRQLFARKDAAQNGQQALQQTISNNTPSFGGSVQLNMYSSTPLSPDIAEPPSVPRLNANRHQRKRSNTNPVLPPPHISTGLRSFSSNAVSSTTTSVLARQTTNTSSYKQSMSTSSHSNSHHTSVADRPNFFEAMGTVRMEAFVDSNYQDGVLYVPAGPPKLPRGNHHRRGVDDSVSSIATDDRNKAGYVFDETGRDPFRGF